MTQEKKTFQQLTSKGVCQIYELLLEDNLVSASFPLSPESIDKVDTIVASINNIYFDIERYITNEEKAVAYLYFIINDHPFTDGNKRTAVLSFKVVCDLNNIIPDPEIHLDALAVYIENKKVKDYQFFIKAIASLLFDKNV